MADHADDQEPLAVDRRFFAALLASDAEALARVLADDFVLVDVLQGGEVPRQALIDAVATGAVRFDSIDLVESGQRRYGTAAIVSGRTRMSGVAGDQSWDVRSRYVHVYIEQNDRWRLVSAQGTQIAGP